MATWQLCSARTKSRGEPGTVTTASPAPRADRASRTLGTAGSPAAGRAEAGAAHGITGGPGGTVTGSMAVQSKEASRAGYRRGAGMGSRPGSPGPAHTPGHPGLPLPGSPSSQKVPLQPAGQVQAPLTWSQAAPCSHWHCRPQPGPKWPWGHPETHGPSPTSAGGSEPDPVLPRASAIPAVARDRGEGTGSLPQGCWAQPQDSAPLPAQV